MEPSIPLDSQKLEKSQQLRLIAVSCMLQIYIDGDLLIEYDHKLPLEKLTHALVDGDLHLYSLYVVRVSTSICDYEVIVLVVVAAAGSRWCHR